MLAQVNEQPDATILDVQISDGVTIVASNGVKGSFLGSPAAGSRNPSVARAEDSRASDWSRSARSPIERVDALGSGVSRQRPDCMREGRDPLTGEVIAGKARGQRHTKTGRVFMAFSTLDIALWDLRGKLLGKPAYQIIGGANRSQVPVYWRPGEADKGLDDARRRAREAYDRGYHYQKWYFTKSAKDGPSGMKENIELVRVLREELPDAHLMFDNHSIRYYDDVDYSVKLCKAVATYKPFWIEEPICPEHVDGYTRIKEETDVPLAGGEHWHTRWQVKPFLERKCVDFVQSDPVWCGGISEWLEVCGLVQEHPGVKVVPHITSPWIAAPHCVASQAEELCPLLEFNYEGGRKALDGGMTRSTDGSVVMRMPSAPGIT